ncbi:UNVERIFIED_CONTAM: hypothetical protein HDU68_011996 [Siphonaria sp. JEL0065]|nr:hypothetical protein HDU68_011996 [Siphonaria sp. JEL0065]
MLDRFGKGWRAMLAVKLTAINDVIDPDDKEAAKKKLLNMLQIYMQRLKKVDRDLLLHFAMVHVHFGMLEDAFVILERFITQPPYSEDAVLLGYAGLLSFVLWRMQTDRIQESSSQEQIQSQSYNFALSQTTIDESDEATKMLQLDPICQPQLALMPLIESIEANLPQLADLSSIPIYLNILGILACRLDYDINADIWIWNKLCHYVITIRLLNPHSDDPVWADRKLWWLEFHAPLGNNNNYSSFSVDYAIIKSVSLYLTTGPSTRLKTLLNNASIQTTPNVFPTPTLESISPLLLSYLTIITPSQITTTTHVIQSCLVHPQPKRRRTCGPRFNIPHGHTDQEIMEFMQGDFGFGDLNSYESSSDEDEEADGYITGYAMNHMQPLPHDEVSGAGNTGGKIKKTKPKQKKKVAVRSNLSHQFIEDSDDSDGGGGGIISEDVVLEYFDGGSEISSERRVYENVVFSDDELEVDGVDNVGRGVILWNDGDLPFDAIENQARWGAKSMDAAVLNEAIVIGGGGVGSDTDDTNDSSSDDDGFDLEAAVKEAVGSESP